MFEDGGRSAVPVGPPPIHNNNPNLGIRKEEDEEDEENGGGRENGIASFRRQRKRRRRWTDMSVSIPIDPSPYQIVDTMQLSKVDLVFKMLKINQAYVTRSGSLIGIITRTSLRKFIGDRARKPTDRCLQLMNALKSCLGCYKSEYERVPEESNWEIN